jgi:hypothetical protein
MPTLHPVASAVLVIGYILLSLCTAAALGLLAFGVSKLNAKLEELTAKVDPLLTRADEMLTLTNDKLSAIGDRAEEVLARGEETAESVHQKVDKTATAVQRTIHAPIIGLNSLAAGVSRGVETFGKLQRRDGDGAQVSVSLSENGVTTTNGRGASDGTSSPTERSF